LTGGKRVFSWLFRRIDDFFSEATEKWLLAAVKRKGLDRYVKHAGAACPCGVYEPWCSVFCSGAGCRPGVLFSAMESVIGGRFKRPGAVRGILRFMFVLKAAGELEQHGHA